MNMKWIIASVNEKTCFQYLNFLSISFSFFLTTARDSWGTPSYPSICVSKLANLLHEYPNVGFRPLFIRGTTQVGLVQFYEKVERNQIDSVCIFQTK